MGVLQRAKILQSFSDMETEDAIKEAFVSAGEAYMLRKEMSNQVGDEDIGAANGRHLATFSTATSTPWKWIHRGIAVLNATGHYILHRGVLITRIRDDASTTPDTLQVSMVATRPDGSTLNFQVYIPEGEERYTTKYGLPATTPTVPRPTCIEHRHRLPLHAPLTACPSTAWVSSIIETPPQRLNVRQRAYG
ncbi:MAG: hypothetical protein R2857_01735 [Vampirovibrionales bacterium]